MICISTLCFILSTLPELQEDIQPEEDSFSNNANNESALIDLSLLFEVDHIDYTAIKLVLRVIDWMTVAYFCLEYIVRFICAPGKKIFFFQVSN